MNNQNSFARCLAYLNSQTLPKDEQVQVQNPPRMAVAISRQTGSGASRIARKLAEYLETHEPSGERPWTVFDKDLIARVLEDHHLPARLAAVLPEDKVNGISDAVDEILGLHPASWIIVEQSVETILKLAELGNVILIGRGANAVTSRLPNVVHVRLVGSLEKRVARVQAGEHLDRSRALAFVRRNDRGRVRYVKRYFHRDITDVLHYDFTINTDSFSAEEVAELIGGAVLRRVEATRGEVRQAA